VNELERVVSQLETAVRKDPNPRHRRS
jgi:hypothetical protein